MLVEHGRAELGVQYKVKFACDNNKHARDFYLHHHECETFIDDAMSPVHAEAPEVDVYCAGWPCQGFSNAGLLHGPSDERSQVIDGVMTYVSSKLPKCFFLENVPNLVSKFPDEFARVLKKFESMKLPDGSTAYSLSWKIFNTIDNGAPQSRRRVYIVGLRTDCIVKTFKFPTALPKRLLSQGGFLDKRSAMEGKQRLPPASQTVSRKNVQAVIAELKKAHVDPRKHHIVIDCGSSTPHYNIDYAPTLTATRSEGEPPSVSFQIGICKGKLCASSGKFVSRSWPRRSVADLRPGWHWRAGVLTTSTGSQA